MSATASVSKSKKSTSSTRQFFAHEAATAKEKLGHALHPRRATATAKLTVVVDQASAEETRVVVRELRTELQLERTEVLEPLLHRMSDIADRLEEGQPVPPKVIGEGIDLWQLYVNRLHDVHVGQFAAARSSMPHDAACTLPLVEVVQDPERAELRIRELKMCLAAYEARSGASTGLLAAVMQGGAKSELAWENFEEDFATSCLPDHLTTTALRQWTTSLIETRDAGELARRKVREYVEQTAEYAHPRPAA